MECSLPITQLQAAIKSMENVTNFDDAAKCLPVLKQIFYDNPTEQRNIIYFLWLNSDHGFSDQLSNEFSVGLLIDTMPTVPTQWTIEISFLIGVEKFLLEIVQFCPSGFSNRLVIEILRSVDCTKHWTFYRQLADILLSREIESVENGVVSKSLVNCLSEVLEKFADSVSTSLKTANHEISGAMVLSFLELIHSAIAYRGRHVASELKDFYELNETYDNPDDGLVDYNNDKNLEIFFKQLEKVLNLINFDIWILWADISLPDTVASIQSQIGETIFTICDKIESLKVSVPDEILQCLNHLKITPISLENLIKKSSCDDIVEVMKEDKEKEMEKWYDALFSAKEAWDDPEIISILMAKIKYAQNPETVLKKFASIIHHKNAFDLLSSLEALKNLNTTFQVTFLELVSQINEIWRIHPNSIPSAGSNITQNKIIEVFNKFSCTISADEFFQIILTCLILQPKEVVHKIFEFAISIEEHTVCVEVLNMSRSMLTITNFLDASSGKVIADATLIDFISNELILNGNLNDRQYNSLVKFYTSLANAKVLSDNFVEKFLLSTLDEALLHSNWELGYRLFQLFECVFSKDFCDNVAPLLVYLAELLSVTMWDDESFDVIKAQVNDKVAKFSLTLLEEWVNELTNDDLKFLTNEMDNFSHIVKSHFSSLWLRSNEDQLSNYGESLQSFENLLLTIRSEFNAVQNETDVDFLVAVVQVLPIIHPWELETVQKICSQKLSDDICDESPELTVKAFEIISKSLSVLAASLNSKFQPVFERCMKHFSCLFDSHLSSLPVESYCNILQFFLQPFRYIKDKAIRGKWFILNIPLMRIAYNEGVLFAYNVKEIGDILREIDEGWEDKLVDWHLHHNTWLPARSVRPQVSH